MIPNDELLRVMQQYRSRGGEEAVDLNVANRAAAFYSYLEEAEETDLLLMSLVAMARAGMV